jgi:hypothetical protein
MIFDRISSAKAIPGGYRFGRTQGRRFRVRARGALRRVNGHLKDIIGAVAKAKLHRLERRHVKAVPKGF